MVGIFQILGLLEHLKKLEPNQFIGIHPLGSNPSPPTTSHGYDILNMMVEWTYSPLVRYLIWSATEFNGEISLNKEGLLSTSNMTSTLDYLAKKTKKKS
jgi:hypothetical protein